MQYALSNKFKYKPMFLWSPKVENCWNIVQYCIFAWRVTQGFSWVFMINKLGRVIVSLVEVYQSTTKEIIAFMFENYLRKPNQRES